MSTSIEPENRPQPPWQTAAERMNGVRQLLRALGAAKTDLSLILPSLVISDPESRWGDVEQHLDQAITAVDQAVSVADGELHSFLERNPESTLAVETMRFLMQRSRRTLIELQEAWNEVDEVLTNYIVTTELATSETRPGSWSSWGGDADLAREEASRVMTEIRSQRPDDYILRFKYERGFTQQKIGELLNMSQSTVAMRMARVDDHLATHVAIRRALAALESAGFHVSPDSPATYRDHLECVRGEEWLMVAVATSMEAAGPKTRTLGRPTSDDKLTLTRFSQASRRPRDATMRLLAIYFRKDGALGFYRLPNVMKVAESEPNFSFDAFRRDDAVVFWELDAAVTAAKVKGGKALSTNKKG